KDAAIRYAQAEAGRAPDAVRLTASPLELPFTRNQIGRGEGLPAWWRLDRATRGAKSFAERMPIMGDVDRRWLAIDLGLVAGLGALCLAVPLLLSGGFFCPYPAPPGAPPPGAVRGGGARRHNAPRSINAVNLK